MHDELHFSGSPLDIYLTELGSDFADGAITHPSYSLPGVVDPTELSHSSAKAKATLGSLDFLAQEAHATVAALLGDHGLLNDGAMAHTPIERRPPCHHTRYSVCLLSLFGTLRVTLHSGFLPAAYANALRPVLRGGLLICSAWLSTQVACSAYRSLWLRSLRMTALRTSVALVHFWEVAHHALEIAVRQEKAKLILVGEFKIGTAWRRVSSLFESIDQHFCALLGFAPAREHGGVLSRSHLPFTAVLRAILRQIWEVQTEILLQMLQLIRRHKLNDAKCILEAVLTHVEIVRHALLKEVRLQHAHLATCEIQAGMRQRCPEYVAGVVGLHNVSCLALSHACIGIAEGLRSAGLILQWLGAMAPYVEEAAKMHSNFRNIVEEDRGDEEQQNAKEKPGDEQVDKTRVRLDQRGVAENGVVEDPAGANVATQECAAFGGSAVPLPGITIVHEAQANPAEAEPPRIAGPLLDDAEVSFEGRRLWQACSMELQGILQARSLGYGIHTGDRECAMDTGGVAWEAWGTGPSLEAPGRRTNPFRRQLPPLALELQVALEARLLARQHIAQDEVTLGAAQDIVSEEMLEG